MERTKLIALAILFRRLKKKRKNRIQWVHPINIKRNEASTFFVLYQELRKYEEIFYNYFWMSMQSFDDLHERIKDRIKRHNTSFRKCIHPLQMQAVTLR